MIIFHIFIYHYNNMLDFVDKDFIIGFAALFFALYRAIFMMIPMMISAENISQFFHAFVLIA